MHHQPGQQTLHCVPPQTSLQPPLARQHCASLPGPSNIEVKYQITGLDYDCHRYGSSTKYHSVNIFPTHQTLQAGVNCERVAEHLLHRNCESVCSI